METFFYFRALITENACCEHCGLGDGNANLLRCSNAVYRLRRSDAADWSLWSDDPVKSTDQCAADPVAHKRSGYGYRRSVSVNFRHRRPRLSAQRTALFVIVPSQPEHPTDCAAIRHRGRYAVTSRRPHTTETEATTTVRKVSIIADYLQAKAMKDDSARADNLRLSLISARVE